MTARDRHVGGLAGAFADAVPRGQVTPAWRHWLSRERDALFSFLCRRIKAQGLDGVRRPSKREATMCDCGVELSRRHWLFSTLVASVAAMVTPNTAAQAEDSPAVQEVLRKAITVDVHSHAAGLILRGEPDSSLAEGMKRGGMAAVCLAHVPDGPLLARKPTGGLTMGRQPAEGELYTFHMGRLDWVDQLVAKHGVRRVLNATDLQEAHAKGQPAIIQDIEGCDFLDGKLERLEEAHRRGVRVIQLVHYIPNPLGDYQTGDVRHNGMTAFGG